MRQRHIITVILLLLTVAATAQARTGSWKAVERLRPGTHIFVNAAGRPVSCFFVRATDKELVCRPAQPLPIWMRELGYRFDRRMVREVRLEHSDAFNGLVGSAIGAGAGAAVLSAGSRSQMGAAAGLGALFGGALGGAFGMAHPLFHGKVVYKR